MNKMNNCLMMVAAFMVFVHTDKNHRFLLLETNKC